MSSSFGVLRSHYLEGSGFARELLWDAGSYIASRRFGSAFSPVAFRFLAASCCRCGWGWRASSSGLR